MIANLYYFSGTGNGIYISKTIKEQLLKTNPKVSSVNLLPMTSFDLNYDVEDSADIVGLIYPVYFLDAPDIVKRFSERLKLKNGSYIFLYAHFGGMLGDALHNIKVIFEKRKIDVSNMFKVALPDNSIIFPTKSNKIKPMLDEGRVSIVKSSIVISNLSSEDKNEKSGIVMKGVGKLIKGISLHYLGFKKMKVDDTCNGCGLCSKVCPMKNIEMKNQKPKFSDKCEMCFACIHNCPKQAVKYNRMKAKGNYQYRHPEVSVSELRVLLKD